MPATIEISIHRLADDSLTAELRAYQRGVTVLAHGQAVTINTTALTTLSNLHTAYGSALAEMVFPVPLRAAWERARGQAETEGAGVHLRVLIDDPSGALHALRWELLRDPATHAALAQQEGGSLARTVVSESLHDPAPPAKPKLRALVAVAGPSDLVRYNLTPFDVADEAERVRQALGDIKADLLADTAPGAPGLATLTNIKDGLRGKAELLYLVCHGQQTEAGTTLYLVGDDGKAAPTTGAALASEIASFGAAYRPLLAVLVACEGGSQEDAPLAAVGPLLARAGVPAVIAMQAKLSMAAAARLTTRLLHELARDGRIDRALAAARKELGDEWWVPVLWLRARDGRLWEEALPADPAAILASMPLDTIPDPAPLPPGSRMPLSRNPLFVGRADDLLALARTLKGHGTVAIGPSAAATGMGGIGKTNLATEFAHRYGQYFAGGVFWLSFADPFGIPAEVATSGAALGIPNLADLKLDEQILQVQAAWQQPIPRLLIFDNCDDTEPGQAEALIQQWRPTSGGSRVLLTSRRAKWSHTLNVTAYSLGVLARTESLALLHKHRPDLAEDTPSLDAIAKELGDLPLALHLAGSFLENYCDNPGLGDPDAFLSELRDQRLHGHEALQGIDVTPSPTNHDLHVARTFALSYGRLADDNPVDAQARALLARAACLAPGDPIPRTLLLESLRSEQDDHAAKRQAERGLQRLVALGLLEPAGEGSLRMHRLVRRFVEQVGNMAAAHDDVAKLIWEQAKALVQQQNTSLAQSLQSHMLAVTDHAVATRRTDACKLCNEVGLCLNLAGDLITARYLFEQALDLLSEDKKESDDQSAILYNLVGCLWDLGLYDIAKQHAAQVVYIDEQLYGSHHEIVAKSINALAMMHQETSDYAAARPLHERALAITEASLGPTHPTTATSLNNLAINCYYQGELAAAAELMRRALAIREQRLGPDHPDTQRSQQSLAAIEQRLAGE